ncbi:MAG: hypothetical protein ABWY12_11190 [Burkholderiales bacterium]
MNNDKPLTLKDVALAASDKNKGARGRELGRIAKGRGLKLTYTTVDHMLEGRYKSKPGRSTLDALAVLSELPREQVYAAAGVPLPLKPLAEDLPPDADLLTGPQRRVVIDTVRLFAQQNRALHESEARLEQAGIEHGNSSAEKSDGLPAGVERATGRDIP